MGAQMRAVVKPRPAPGLELQRVPVPTIGPDDVLVKVKVTSICGTDRHIYEWDEWSQATIRPPQVIGHELAGHVVEVGRQVRSVGVGDFVSAETHLPCGECLQCRTGRMHVCQNMRILGVHTDGCFAEYVKLPAAVVWKNDPDLPPAVASVQEPLGNAVDTVLAEPVTGKSLLITGCGPAGLLGIAVARAAGAFPIIATDVNDYRLRLARSLGATTTLNPGREAVVEAVRALTGGDGVEVFAEFSGHPGALAQGLEAVTPGGRVSLLGLYRSPVEVDLNRLVIFKALTVYGITGRKMFETWYRVRSLLASGELDVTPALTHQFPLEAFAEAMELMSAGACGKIVLWVDGVPAELDDVERPVREEESRVPVTVHG